MHLSFALKRIVHNCKSCKMTVKNFDSGESKFDLLNLSSADQRKVEMFIHSSVHHLSSQAAECLRSSVSSLTLMVPTNIRLQTAKYSRTHTHKHTHVRTDTHTHARAHRRTHTAASCVRKKYFHFIDFHFLFCAESRTSCSLSLPRGQILRGQSLAC